MKSLTTKAAPVTRITQQFGFKAFGSPVLSVTFSGRITPTGPRETFVVSFPTQGWNRKDKSVTISNRSACWGWSESYDCPVNVFDFEAETIRTKDGLFAWTHKS